MKTVEIENDVFDKLAEIAIPFVEINPSMVIRRLLEIYSGSIVSINEDNKTQQKMSYSYMSNNLAQMKLTN